MSRRQTILDEVLAMPAMPSSAVQAIELLHDPDAEMDAVAAALELDPGLTANVLRLANSCLSASVTAIVTVRDAVVRLGCDRIQQIVLASTVGAAAKVEIRGYDIAPGELWRHSVAVGLGTQVTGEVVGVQAPRAAFTAGLLHDIGRIVLATFEDNDAAEILRVASEQDIPFEEAERAVLGTDHCELGAVLLESWGLPGEVVEVVRWHHTPSQVPGSSVLADLVHIADQITTMAGVGLGREGLQYRIDRGAIERLGLQPEHGDAIACQTLDALARLGPLFQIDDED